VKIEHHPYFLPQKEPFVSMKEAAVGKTHQEENLVDNTVDKTRGDRLAPVVKTQGTRRREGEKSVKERDRLGW
jgi:hypothetical protein